MRQPRTWYQRRAPLIATGALALGVTYVTASVSQAAMRNTLIESGSRTPATLQSVATPASTQTATTSLSTDAATSEPNLAGDVPADINTANSAESGLAEPQVDPVLEDEFQHILDGTVADGSIPGALLSVRLPNGAIWTGASGQADRNAGVPMQPDMRVRVGSLSKMYTAVVVLQLVEEGTIDLDAPVATWLPDLLPKADVITVRQLLQHTSGLYDYLQDRRLISQAYEEPERVWKPQELVAYATRFPAPFAPGAKNSWNYSSTNYVILGMIVERATGHTLGQELRQRIFEPLGLRQTYVIPEENVEGPQAHGYSKSDDHTEVSLSVAFAAANIVTTVDDLRQFGMALFTGQLLEPATWELMGQYVDGKGRYNMPSLEYGLGLMRHHLPVGPGPDGQPRPEDLTRVVGHIGGFGGFRAALWYVPESGTLIALSVNQTSTDPNGLATQVFEAILQQQGG
jgi:D-alanyl-D-alanine carboxypeptidase